MEILFSILFILILLLIAVGLLLWAEFHRWRRGKSVSGFLPKEFSRNREEQSNQAERLRKEQADQAERSRKEQSEQAQRLREELQTQMQRVHKGNTDSIQALQDRVSKSIDEMKESQGKDMNSVEKRVKDLSDSNETRLNDMRTTIEKKMESLQKSNEGELEKMRKTVDEQLQSTLEKRLGKSFELVSKQLDAVHEGLGKMQQLATGVGDLKAVLTNVKTRGTWGEIQLGALMEQILTQRQFGRNVQPNPESNERVEFAVKLPGPKNDPEQVVWLPIDSKFPQEDYNRLMDASETGDQDAVRKASKSLKRAMESAAADINSKYIAPPRTTDFGILFLPTEGLYAEVARDPELIDRLQQRFRVVPAGPTTLSAILNALQMGFRSLTIQEQSSKVWSVLAEVKSEFGKFGTMLSKAKKQLDTASSTIEELKGRRTRAIDRKLKAVESPSEPEPEKLNDLEEIYKVLEDEEGDE